MSMHTSRELDVQLPDLEVEDIRKAELICGKDVGALKGKSTKTKNAPYVRDLIVPPKALIKKNRETKHSGIRHASH